MEQNLKELLFALNRHSVKYVIIGGYAVFVHAQPRMTKDLDVFIESSPTNALPSIKHLRSSVPASPSSPLKTFILQRSARDSAIRSTVLTSFNKLPASTSPLSMQTAKNY
jgi:hypothetical protein